MTNSLALKGGGEGGCFFLAASLLAGSFLAVSFLPSSFSADGGVFGFDWASRAALAAGALLTAARSWSAGLLIDFFDFSAAFGLAGSFAETFDFVSDLGFAVALVFAGDLAFVLLGAGVFFFTSVFTDVLDEAVLRTALFFAADLFFAVVFFVGVAGVLVRAFGLAGPLGAAPAFIGCLLEEDDWVVVFLAGFFAIFFMGVDFFTAILFGAPAGCLPVLALTVLLDAVFVVLDAVFFGAVFFGAVFFGAVLRGAAFAAGLRVDFAVFVFFVAIIPITVAIVEMSCRSCDIP